MGRTATTFCKGFCAYVILLFIDVCDPIFRRWEIFCNFPQLSDASAAAAAVSLGFFRERTPPENFRQWASVGWLCRAAARAKVKSQRRQGRERRIAARRYVFFCFAMTGFVYPIVVAWTWSCAGWLNYVGAGCAAVFSANRLESIKEHSDAVRCYSGCMGQRVEVLARSFNVMKRIVSDRVGPCIHVYHTVSRSFSDARK